jgi:uncharacterized RDD family membrane protein YckC
VTARPGWYPDPRGAGAGALRYFDGTSWTDHVAVPPPVSAPRWKGARYGRPPVGPGALASPARRLAARLLDGLILLPAWIVLLIVVLVEFIHLNSSWTSGPANQGPPIAAIVTLELSFFGIVVVIGVCTFLYEALTTVRWGRSPGKVIMHIRPLRLDGSTLSTGRAFARAGAYYLGSFLNLVQLLDVLWCLWDEDSQCLHDKLCETLVVSDD